MKPKNLLVENLMSTALITARPDESVDAADFDMKLARVRHLPVVDDKRNLVGVVSDRDVLRAVSKIGRRSVQVKDVMSTDVFTVGAEDPAEQALDIMLDQKIGCLPVEGDDGHLVGLITETDFLELAQRSLFNEERSDLAEAG